jgi:cytochrome c
MTFAGLSNPEDRANVIAFLNARSDAPRPHAGGSRRERRDAKTGKRPGHGREAAQKEGVLTEQQAVKGGQKNIGGEGAPKLTGTDPSVKKE